MIEIKQRNKDFKNLRPAVELNFNSHEYMLFWYFHRPTWHLLIYVFDGQSFSYLWYNIKPKPELRKTKNK